MLNLILDFCLMEYNVLTYICFLDLYMSSRHTNWTVVAFGSRAPVSPLMIFF